jgi:transcriptional regulator with XRE-family HTH domain
VVAEANINEPFGLVLKRLRATAELSQDEFAHHCGFSRQYLSMLELGENSPTLNKLSAVGGAFGQSLAELALLIEEENSANTANEQSAGSSVIF